MNFLHALTGSFAQPAAENPTVAMIEAAYRHHGLEWRYVNCEVAPEQLAAAVRGARAMGWAGFNCSLPHKLTVIEHLDGLAPSAEIIGAVNTVVMRDGLWIGENTDGQGFVEALRPVCDLEGQRVTLFGAGGAARAVAAATSPSLLTAGPVASQPHPDRKAVLVDLSAMLMNDILGIGGHLQRSYRQNYAFDARNSAVVGVRGQPGLLVLETNNHFATANIAVPQPGSIESFGDRDVFTWTAPASEADMPPFGAYRVLATTARDGQGYAGHRPR